MSKRAKAEALLVFVAMIWGSTFVVVKEALSDAAPLPFIAVRFTLAGILLFVVVSRGLVDRRALLPGVILGGFLFAGYVLQTTGLLYTTPSKSAFITASSVILVPVIQVLHGFRLRLAAVVGALCGLAGIYLLVLPSGLAAVNRGDVLTLFAAMAFAVHIVLVGVYTKQHSFRHLVPVQILTVGILGILSLPVLPSVRFQLTAGLAAALILTAALPTAFAFSVQNWAQQFTPPAHTALIFALEPAFAAFTSRLVLGERFGGKVFLGAALILAGMIVSEIWSGTPPSPVEG